MYDQDHVYRQLARRYADAMGTEWLMEQQKLSEQGIGYLTPRADEKVALLTGQKKRTGRRIYIPVLATVAAVVLLVVGLQTLLQRSPQSGSQVQDEGSGITSDQNKPVQPDADLILPLTFIPPADLMVSYSEYDNGQTIYIFASHTYGDTVLTMEPRENRDGKRYDNMKTLSLDGCEVLSKIDRDSRVIVFDYDGILYTLSSRYSTDVLVLLHHAICHLY